MKNERRKYMNNSKQDILNNLIKEPFINQRILAAQTGHSLGIVNRSIKELLTEGHTKLLKGFKSKQGKNFDAIVAFDGDYNTTFVFPEKKCKSSYPKKRK